MNHSLICLVVWAYNVNVSQVVDIPSGYLMLQPDGNKIVRSKVIPEMRDSDVTKPGKTVWYFDHVPNYTQCFDHTVRRYYPVANITR